MRSLSVKRNGVPFNAERSEHCAERKIKIEEDRALLDVQLQIRGRVFQFVPGILDPFEIDSVFLDRIH